jgi:hypothetical protein
MLAQVQLTGLEVAVVVAAASVEIAAVGTGSDAYDERMRHHLSHRLVSLLMEVAEESPR